MREFCICGHSKKSHVMDLDNTRCCVVWESKNTGHTMMCECMKFELENKSYGHLQDEMASLNKDRAFDDVSYYAKKSTSNKRDGSPVDVVFAFGKQRSSNSSYKDFDGTLYISTTNVYLELNPTQALKSVEELF